MATTSVPERRYPCSPTNFDGADIRIQDNRPLGLAHREMGIGETAGPLDIEHRQRSDRIVRICGRLITLIRNGHKWHVAYPSLHMMMDAETASKGFIDTQMHLPMITARWAGRTLAFGVQ